MEYKNRHRRARIVQSVIQKVHTSGGRFMKKDRFTENVRKPFFSREHSLNETRLEASLFAHFLSTVDTTEQ
jgi:homoserine kinase